MPGNNFGGFLKLIKSDDYAVDYFLILESASWASWSRLHNDFYCDYRLLNTYKYKENEFLDLDKETIEININKFKQACPIQALTVVDINSLREEYRMSEIEKNAILFKKQIQFFSID